jgi:hypothetical protein
MSDEWPFEIRGVTESVVTTLGPNDRWNVAALGLHEGAPITATTWGRTRTWRNFRERGAGYVQVTRDPLDFVEAALAIREEDDPILDSADAWAEVSVTERDAGESAETQWVEWELSPRETGVAREVVPITNRGHAAVVEATVAASRLGVDAYDRSELRARLDYFADVVEAAGGDAEQAAFERLRELADWNE